MGILKMILGFDSAATGVPVTTMNSAATILMMNDMAEQQTKA